MLSNVKSFNQSKRVKTLALKEALCKLPQANGILLYLSHSSHDLHPTSCRADTDSVTKDLPKASQPQAILPVSGITGHRSYYEPQMNLFVLISQQLLVRIQYQRIDVGFFLPKFIVCLHCKLSLNLGDTRPNSSMAMQY